MTSRVELAATAGVASVALAADVAAVATGHGTLAAIAVAPALAACAGLSAFGYARVARRAAAARRDARSTDPITRLPDAPQLRVDLDEFLTEHPAGERRTLVIIDLVGFKRYNDAFGFACGDALLRRLARKLEEAVGPRGEVYRLRGAQFAVVAQGTQTSALRAAAADAMLESGEGFMVRGAHGSVVLPGEAHSISRALKLADQEIQAQRATLRSHGLEEPSIAAYRPPSQIEPSPFDIVELTGAVGQCLGMTGQDLDNLEIAVGLRDVGMMAVPQEIVRDPQDTGGEAQEFRHLHTLAGERLLRSNFRMDAVADVVRSSHERWDGTGFPDGLAGEDIGLAARIVHVCGTFEDLTSHHADRPLVSVEDALRELRRGSESAYDPAVVCAFVEVFTDRIGAAGGAIGHPAA